MRSVGKSTSLLGAFRRRMNQVKEEKYHEIITKKESFYGFARWDSDFE